MPFPSRLPSPSASFSRSSRCGHPRENVGRPGSARGSLPPPQQPEEIRQGWGLSVQQNLGPPAEMIRPRSLGPVPLGQRMPGPATSLPSRCEGAASSLKGCRLTAARGRIAVRAMPQCRSRLEKAPLLQAQPLHGCWQGAHLVPGLPLDAAQGATRISYCTPGTSARSLIAPRRPYWRSWCTS